jgi:hypothetical protein
VHHPSLLRQSASMYESARMYCTTQVSVVIVDTLADMCAVCAQALQHSTNAEQFLLSIAGCCRTSGGSASQLSRECQRRLEVAGANSALHITAAYS